MTAITAEDEKPAKDVAISDAGVTTGAQPGSPASSHISDLRKRIDEIDESLITLWLERANLSKEVGATRVASGGTRLVLAREGEVLTRFRTALGPEGTQLGLLLLRAGRGPLLAQQHSAADHS